MPTLADMCDVRWRSSKTASWSGVHVRVQGRLICGLRCPEWPYKIQEGDQVPINARGCVTCTQAKAAQRAREAQKASNGGDKNVSFGA